MIAINMKMPENCVECRFSQGDYGFCHAMPENFCGYVHDDECDGKPDWCPLYQVDKVLSERILSGAEIKLLGEQVSDAYAKQDVIARLIRYISDTLNSTHYVQYGVKEESNPYGLELDKRYRAIMYVVKMKEDENGTEDGENI